MTIKIISLWEGIRTRPTMYIGKKSIYGLQCLLTGIMCVENMTQQKAIDFDWHGFEAWVAKKIRKRLNSRSFGAALSKCDNDDEKAFDLWMKWIDEYEKKVGNGKAEEEDGGGEGEEARTGTYLY